MKRLSHLGKTLKKLKYSKKGVVLVMVGSVFLIILDIVLICMLCRSENLRFDQFFVALLFISQLLVSLIKVVTPPFQSVQLQKVVGAAVVAMTQRKRTKMSCPAIRPSGPYANDANKSRIELWNYLRNQLYMIVVHSLTRIILILFHHQCNWSDKIM